MTSKKRLRTSDFSLPKAKRQALRDFENDEAGIALTTKTALTDHVTVELRYNNALCINDLEDLASTYPEINHLDLTGCFYLPSTAVPLITDLWGTSLTSLNLGWCLSLTESLHLTPPNSSYLALRNLDLSNSHISDPGVRFLATRSPDLSKLDLQGCGRISDLSLSLVAQFCKNVSSLNVSGCGRITNFGIQLFTQEMKDNLRELNLNDCKQLSGILLNYLAFYCPNVSRLFLRGTNITGDEVAKLCEVLILTELNVHGLSVNNDNLRSIVESQPSLEILDISFCHNVTHKGIVDVLKHCSNLQELHAYGLNLCLSEFKSLFPNVKVYS